FQPLEIHFNEAIGIGFVALAVNLVCAVLLKGAHHHHAHDHHDHVHHHGDDHDHVHEHPPSPGSGAAGDHDLNLRAAYLHVLADAFTTCLAIIALTSGKFLGWAWLDPVVGLV